MDKPAVIGSAPILLVSDVVASANYFRDKVGFTYDQIWGDPPNFCILWRDHCHLMLSQVRSADQIIPHHRVVEGMWNVYFWVDDVEGMYQEMRRSGAIIDYEPSDQAYGCREFGIQDPDGHDIAFGQEIQSGAPPED